MDEYIWGMDSMAEAVWNCVKSVKPRGRVDERSRYATVQGLEGLMK